MLSDFRKIYQLLSDAQVRYIVIGGGAANLLGSPRNTLDVDVVYSREAANMQKLVDCLAPFHPYLRGAPPGLPFVLDLATFRNGLNFTLTTDLGSLDLLGEVVGGGKYEELLPDCGEIAIDDLKLTCVTLDKLIELKRAAGRPKDFEAIAELEAIRQEQGRI